MLGLMSLLIGFLNGLEAQTVLPEMTLLSVGLKKSIPLSE